MNKYNNYKKNDNIIVKARNITLVGAGVGVGGKSRHHRPVGRLKTCSICVYVYICISYHVEMSIHFFPKKNERNSNYYLKLLITYFFFSFFLLRTLK